MLPPFEVTVDNPKVQRGNTAVFQCSVPEAVREHIVVTSWIQDNRYDIFSTSSQGSCTFLSSNNAWRTSLRLTALMPFYISLSLSCFTVVARVEIILFSSISYSMQMEGTWCSLMANCTSCRLGIQMPITFITVGYWFFPVHRLWQVPRLADSFY